MQLCRGNMSGSAHWESGSYDQIATTLSSEKQYDSYRLEFDDVGRTETAAVEVSVQELQLYAREERRV